MGGGLSAIADYDVAALKTMGDSHYRYDQFYEAIFFYTTALSKIERTADPLGGLGDSDGRMYHSVSSDGRHVVPIEKDLLVKLYGNRSAAYACSGSYQKALDDAVHAIEVDPFYTKGYYRAAKALLELRGQESINEAMEYLDKAIAVASQANDDALLLRQLSDLKASLSRGGGTLFRGNGWCYSWGTGEFGQLGLGDQKDRALPHMIDGLRGRHIVDSSCGAMHSVAVLGTGEVVVFGDNSKGQLGKRSFEPIVPAPTIVPILMSEKVVACSCGAGHTIVLTESGRAFSWGVGMSGQLGLGNLEIGLIPRSVDHFKTSTISAVACGIAHSIFLLADGTIYSCGLNTFGQLGLGNYKNGPTRLNTGPSGDTIATPTPVHVSTGKKIVHIACGGAHSLIVDEEGVILSCGSNSCGQLGVGNDNDLDVFTQISFFKEFELNSIEIAFTACGEEFSACITRDREVYTWGLGNVGQLGNGKFDNSNVPYHVDELDNKVVEALTCSQSQVFAICADGSVYNWGLPLNSIGFDTMMNMDKSQIPSRPELATAFSKRRKVRQISCGRKHYLLVAIGVYGPNCYLISPSCDSLAFSAGNNIKILIQSCDINGAKVDQGGSIFQAVLTRREEDIVHDDLVKEAPRVRNITIDDDLDGKYSSRFKIEKSGAYDLNVTVDGLHIMNSPFEIYINPLEPSFEKSYVEWNVPDGGSLRCTVQDELSFKIHLVDNFDNEILDPDIKCGMTLEEKDRENKTTFYGTYNYIDDDGSKMEGYYCKVVPQYVGDFFLHVWVHDINQIAYKAIQHNCALRVDDFIPISPDMCSFSIPLEAIAGEDIFMSVLVKESECDRINENNKFVASFKALSSSLSPRALVRQSAAFDPLRISRHDLSLDASTGSKVWSKQLSKWVAGDYIVKIYVNNHELHSASLYIRHAKACVEFTEVLRSQMFYSSWQQNTEKVYYVQLRDTYGNIVLTNDDVIESFIVSVKENKELKRVVVSSQENGIYKCSAFLDFDIAGAGDVFKVHVTLNGRDIQYSPFAIETTRCTSTDNINTGDVEEPTEPNVLTPRTAEAAKAESYLVQLSKAEITRRRANEVLKKERRKLDNERELRRRQQAVKRCGGGFQVKYSKEI